MLLKKVFIYIASLTIIIAFSVTSSAKEPVNTDKKAYTNKKDNRKCLKCHSSRKYGITNPEDTTKVIFRKMPLDYMIDTSEYYVSNHWNFKCSECHSEQYKKVPHNQELRFNDVPVCMDCHGGDKTYAKYHFEIIETEFRKSIHCMRQDKNFSCWSCHNPHTYKINARNKNLKITQTVEYDNTICLGCHDNNDNLKYFNKQISNIAKTHNWLPNQVDHFRKVRCIECHARINDSILAPHNIQPKTKAVRQCSMCHSTNSLLMKSLYKNSAQKDSHGFLNSRILNDSYVAGTNRNYFLNVLSVVIYLITMLAISVHIYFRIKRN
jgi:Zn finger protein HypA/HybF involved in hydrogenase expression